MCHLVTLSPHALEKIFRLHVCLLQHGLTVFFRSSTAMIDLGHDVLVLIMEKAEPDDLRNLRLVNKGWHSAVRDANIHLRPNKMLLQDQHFAQLCAAFPKATSLDLIRCHHMSPEGLQSIQALSRTLTLLDLKGCQWVDTAAAAHLGELSKLETLALSDCEAIEALPECLSRPSCLKSLNLFNCTSLAAFPESLSNLVGLEMINANQCSEWTSLPEGLSALTALANLMVNKCIALEALPAVLSGLSGLKLLDMMGCSSLAALPAGFGALSALRRLDLSECAHLARLPQDFGGLVSLHMLDLSDCDALEGLPASFRALCSLKVSAQCDAMLGHYRAPW